MPTTAVAALLGVGPVLLASAQTQPAQSQSWENARAQSWENEDSGAVRQIEGELRNRHEALTCERPGRSSPDAFFWRDGSGGGAGS